MELRESLLTKSDFKLLVEKSVLYKAEDWKDYKPHFLRPTKYYGGMKVYIVDDYGYETHTFTIPSANLPLTLTNYTIYMEVIKSERSSKKKDQVQGQQDMEGTTAQEVSRTEGI